MKAITLTQPWATLVAIGAKRIETRSWSTNYRGPLAIHAGKGLGTIGGNGGFMDLCSHEPFKSVLEAYWESLIQSTTTVFELANGMPRGAIIATCNLVSVIGTSVIDHAPYEWKAPDERIYRFYLTDQERAFGDYTPGRFAWLLADVEKLERPIPAKGALGLWQWSEA